MGALFNMDNPFWRTLGKLADLMILNFLFLLCCIPIFTIGASLTGLSYVTLKMQSGEEGYITRSFFKSFRQNFRQATGIWLIALFVGIVFVMDFLILRSMEGTFATIMRVMIAVIVFLYLMIMLYVFAVLSRFDNTIKHTIKNSFIMAIADFPRTILMILVLVAALVVSLFNETTMTWAILVWIMAGFSLVAYCNSYFLDQIFNKYIPKDTSEEEDPDRWDVDETMKDYQKTEVLEEKNEIE